MTTTGTAISTQVFIGKCVVCNQTYRVASSEERAATWCACRAGIECTDWSHGHGSEHWPELDHPYTAIKWKPVKAKTTAKGCDLRCHGASSGFCSCSCGGRNHGRAFTPTPTTREDR